MEQIVRNIIEAEGWSIVSDKSDYIELQIFSPAGEDCSPMFWVEGENNINGLLSSLNHYIEYYDIDNEVYIWLDNSGHGMDGAPYHIEDILNDKKWFLNKLKELKDELECFGYPPEKSEMHYGTHGTSEEWKVASKGEWGLYRWIHRSRYNGERTTWYGIRKLSGKKFFGEQFYSLEKAKKAFRDKTKEQ